MAFRLDAGTFALNTLLQPAGTRPHPQGARVLTMRQLANVDLQDVRIGLAWGLECLAMAVILCFDWRGRSGLPRELCAAGVDVTVVGNYALGVDVRDPEVRAFSSSLGISPEQYTSTGEV